MEREAHTGLDSHVSVLGGRDRDEHSQQFHARKGVQDRLRDNRFDNKDDSLILPGEEKVNWHL